MLIVQKMVQINKKIFLSSILVVVLCAFTLFLRAQPPMKFDPKRFEADLEQFIVKKAGLTPAESAKFFPVYREMRKKQFAYFRGRRFHHIDMSDNNAAAKAIREHDANEVQMKKIQQVYHVKFMKILPAGKVMKIIRAEDDFHRQMFRKAAFGCPYKKE